jgi:hypothetical protein
MANLDALFSGQIVRKDHPMILALNRQQATILPVRLAAASGGYTAGQVLQRDSGTGIFSAYPGASGGGTAAAVLLESLDASEMTSAGGMALARGCFGGSVFQSKLINLDAQAIAALGGKTIIAADGVQVFKF